MVEECARLFMERHPDVRITVAGGGSGHGIKAVGAGNINIGMASRNIKPAELKLYPDLKPVVIAMGPSPSSCIRATPPPNWCGSELPEKTIVITREAGS